MGSDVELMYKIKKARFEGETYESIGEKCGVSGALIWKVARGMCTSHKARHYFGLPPKMVEVVPCRECGEVHTYKACPNPKDSGRYRRAAEFTSDRVWLFDEMLEHLGQSLTEWMNEELDIWLEDQRQSEILMKYSQP